uniref:Uncharacterized protein n=1 Tax=Quercus lobata TaxID=97700 RepID=A0A7N2MA07_QUELO
MLFLALSGDYHTFNEVPCSKSKLSHFNFHVKRWQEYQKDVTILTSCYRIGQVSSHQPVEILFEKLTPQPSCIISDLCLPWTSDIARKFHIPRIFFPQRDSRMKKLSEQMEAANLASYGVIVNTFEELESAYVKEYKKAWEDSLVNESTSVSDLEPFVVPSLPDQIELTRAQLPTNLNTSLKDFKDLHEKINAFEEGGYGVMVNRLLTGTKIC